MNIRSFLEFIRRYVGMFSAAVFLVIFYGFVGAAIARHFFGMEETRSWLFVGLPIGVAVAAAMWKKLPKIFGY